MGAHQGETTEKAYVVKAYLLLGFLSVTTFGLLHIVGGAGDPAVGYLEVTGGLVILCNLLALRVTNNITIARNLFLATLITLLIVMLASGGIGGTGIFWFFMFPIAAYFLTDKRRGSMWVGSLLAIILLHWAFGKANIISMWYGDVAIRQLLVTLIVVSIGLYVYERARERATRRGDESQHDLQEYLDHMTTYSAKLAPDGTVLFANKVLKDAYGSNHPVVGSNFLEGPWWTEPDARARVRELFEKALGGSQVRYTEKFQAATRSDRKELSINISMLPIIENGKTAYILAEARDVTAEQAVDHAKSEFVTLASHQLRTPIAAIRWFSEMLLGGDAGQLSKEQHEHIDHIYHSNQRMANLVDEMLIVSSLELGSLPVTPEPLSVTAFCRKIVNAQSGAVADKKLVIKDHYDTDLAKIPLDPHILKIIMRNLFTNAIKYTPVGGSISLEVARTAKKLRKDSHGSLVIMVNDSGYGIPSTDKERIFTKFFRGQNIKDKDTDGTGLGLYMIKMLLDYVGGTISFTSTENVGSTFVVELPIEGMKPHQPVLARKQSALQNDHA